MQIRDRIKELRRVRAGDLRPNPRNWRTHPQAQQDALRGILAEVGYADALLVRELPDGALEIVDGHLRAEITPDQLVPVLVLDVTEAEAALILASLDPLAAMAEADHDALGKLLHDVDTESDALRTMLDGLAVSAMLGGLGPDEHAPDAQVDRAGELQKQWKTAAGQLWVIPGKAGEHRLLCGDSTKAEDVGRLVGKATCRAVLTDLPFGIGQEGVPGDEPDSLGPLIDAAVPLLPIADAVVVAFQSTRTFPVWLDAVRRAGHAFERILSLYKEAQCTYPWRGWILKSESILVSSVGKPNWQDVKPYVHDVYKVSEVSGELTESQGWHGSVKPLAVVRDILSRISGSSDLVYDPFLGSGTTMVAAEQLGRVCTGIEIEPKYVAVCLQRMKDMGLEPKLAKEPSRRKKIARKGAEAQRKGRRKRVKTVGEAAR